MRFAMLQRMLQLTIVLLFLVGLGCQRADSDVSPAVQKIEPAPSFFNTETAGAIHGTITWVGEVPRPPEFEIRAVVTGAIVPKPRLIRPNPNAPVLDPQTKAVAGAVVFLRGVDPGQARPWDHAPVAIEHADRRLYLLQGEAKTNIGFVRLGDTITAVSREKQFNSLHASGAVFFTLPFPDADQPLARTLSKSGVVELSSAAGNYWMRAYLLVSEHPYLARTDAHGNFELPQVPPGHYRIVCWQPNWNIKSQDRDPESGVVTRVFFATPLEVEREVVVENGTRLQVDLSIPANSAHGH
jgi:hypothetical protein